MLDKEKQTSHSQITYELRLKLAHLWRWAAKHVAPERRNCSPLKNSADREKDSGQKQRQVCLTILEGLDADVRSQGGKPFSDGFRSPLQLSVAQHKLPVNKAFCKTPVALEGCQRDIQQLGDFVFCQAAKES